MPTVNELTGGLHAGVPDAVQQCIEVMNLTCDDAVNEAQLGHSKQRLRISPDADVTKAVAARAMERNGSGSGWRKCPDSARSSCRTRSRSVDTVTV